MDAPSPQPRRGLLARLLAPERPLGMWVFAALALGTLGLDQLTKLLAVHFLHERPPVPLIPWVLNLRWATNTGAAFSLLREHPEILAIGSALISAAVAVWAARLKAHERGLRLPLGLVFGGAIGNLIDRLRLGHVIDFIDVHAGGAWHWPTFNIADSAICIGVGILIFISFLPHDAAPPVQDASPSP